MPESYTHLDFKQDLYFSILENEMYVEVEKIVGNARTDVITEVKGHTLAIEIQHTCITIPNILRRMRAHTKNGAHTLWLITPTALYRAGKLRHLKWVMFIQQIQGGMIFLPTGLGQTIIPARIDNTLKFEEGEILAGTKKYLDKGVPIEIEELQFDRCDQYNINIVTHDEWWLENYLLLD
jgi:competence CoiA-like predicted nuclease